jgi:hypothetical protein
MRIPTAGFLLISSIAIATPTFASGPPSTAPAVSGLRTALAAMMEAAAAPPGQSTRPDDPDQGDDNAALRAIQVVCSHDNPSATRSAICPTPISPG